MVRLAHYSTIALCVSIFYIGQINAVLTGFANASAPEKALIFIGGDMHSNAGGGLEDTRPDDIIALSNQEGRVLAKIAGFFSAHVFVEGVGYKNDAFFKTLDKRYAHFLHEMYASMKSIGTLSEQGKCLSQIAQVAPVNCIEIRNVSGVLHILCNTLQKAVSPGSYNLFLNDVCFVKLSDLLAEHLYILSTLFKVYTDLGHTLDSDNSGAKELRRIMGMQIGHIRWITYKADQLKLDCNKSLFSQLDTKEKQEAVVKIVNDSFYIIGSQALDAVLAAKAMLSNATSSMILTGTFHAVGIMKILQSHGYTIRGEVGTLKNPKFDPIAEHKSYLAGGEAFNEVIDCTSLTPDQIIQSVKTLQQQK